MDAVVRRFVTIYYEQQKLLIRQFACLYMSNVFIYVAYVVAHYGVMVGRYGTTVSL